MTGPLDSISTLPTSTPKTKKQSNW